jgi:hypothetical protein
MKNGLVIRYPPLGEPFQSNPLLSIPLRSSPLFDRFGLLEKHFHLGVFLTLPCPPPLNAAALLNWLADGRPLSISV